MTSGNSTLTIPGEKNAGDVEVLNFNLGAPQTAGEGGGMDMLALESLSHQQHKHTVKKWSIGLIIAIVVIIIIIIIVVVATRTKNLKPGDHCAENSNCANGTCGVPPGGTIPVCCTTSQVIKPYNSQVYYCANLPKGEACTDNTVCSSQKCVSSKCD